MLLVQIELSLFANIRAQINLCLVSLWCFLGGLSCCVAVCATSGAPLESTGIPSSATMLQAETQRHVYDPSRDLCVTSALLLSKTVKKS